MHAIGESPTSESLHIKTWFIATCYQQAKWQVPIQFQRAKKLVQSLFFPIVPDQQKNEGIISKSERSARSIPASEAGRRIKASRVDGIRNENHIFTLKKRLELPGNKLRNSRQMDTRISVNATLQKHNEPVVKLAMQRKRPIENGKMP